MKTRSKFEGLLRTGLVLAVAAGLVIGETGCGSPTPAASRPEVALTTEDSLADLVLTKDEVTLLATGQASPELRERITLTSAEAQMAENCYNDVNYLNGVSSDNLGLVKNTLMKLGAQTHVILNSYFTNGVISEYVYGTSDPLLGIQNKDWQAMSAYYKNAEHNVFFETAKNFYVESRITSEFAKSQGVMRADIEKASIKLAEQAKLLIDITATRQFPAMTEIEARLEKSDVGAIYQKLVNDPTVKLSDAEQKVMTDYAAHLEYQEILNLKKLIDDRLSYLGLVDKDVSVLLTGDGLGLVKEATAAITNDWNKKENVKRVLSSYKNYLVTLKMQAMNIDRAQADKTVTDEITKLVDSIPQKIETGDVKKILQDYGAFLTPVVAAGFARTMPAIDAEKLAKIYTENISMAYEHYYYEAVSVPEQLQTVSKTYVFDKDNVPTDVKLQFNARAAHKAGEAETPPQLQSLTIPLPNRFADFKRLSYFVVDNGKDGPHTIMAAIFEGFDEKDLDVNGQPKFKSFLVPIGHHLAEDNNYQPAQEIFDARLTVIDADLLTLPAGSKNGAYELGHDKKKNEGKIILPKGFMEREFKTHEIAVAGGVPLQVAMDAMLDRITESKVLGLDALTGLPIDTGVHQEINYRTGTFNQDTNLLIAQRLNGNSWKIDEMTDVNGQPITAKQGETVGIPSLPETIDDLGSMTDAKENLLYLTNGTGKDEKKYIKLRKLTKDWYVVAEYGGAQDAIEIGQQYTQSQMADWAFPVSKPYFIIMMIPAELGKNGFMYDHVANPYELTYPMTFGQSLFSSNTKWARFVLNSTKESYRSNLEKDYIYELWGGLWFKDLDTIGFLPKEKLAKLDAAGELGVFGGSLEKDAMTYQWISYAALLKVSGAAFNSYDLRGLKAWQQYLNAIAAAKNGSASNVVLINYLN